MDVLDRFDLAEGEQVRLARPEELPVVVGLCLLAVGDHGTESHCVRMEPEAVGELGNLVAVYTGGDDRDLAALLLDIGGQVAGYALVEIDFQPWVDAPRTATVNGMYILSEWRDARRSMALLRAIRDWGRERGASRIEWRSHHTDKGIFKRLAQPVQTIYRMEV